MFQTALRIGKAKLIPQLPERQIKTNKFWIII